MNAIVIKVGEELPFIVINGDKLTFLEIDNSIKELNAGEVPVYTKDGDNLRTNNYFLALKLQKVAIY